MQLDRDDLDYLCDCAIAAAKQVGQLIESYTNKTVRVQHKEAGNSIAAQVVTEVDLRSEAIIVKALQPTCKRYDLALLTEESTDDKSRLQKDWFWCVDPMDGTLSFVESTPGYSVSIALVARSGVPVIGVVYDPVTHTLYSAIKGRGACRNGKPLSLDSSSGAGKPMTLVCDRGFAEKPYYPRLHKALELIAIKHGYTGLQTLEKNGAVLNACLVLETPSAVYFKCPKSEEGGGSLWDFAATAVLFHAAGFVASDFYGNPLELNRAESTFMNHRGVIYAQVQLLVVDIQGLLALCRNDE